MKKKIIIICGVSASGKDTLLEMLLKDPKLNLKRVVTYTNRVKRTGDDNYHFLSESDFEKRIKKNFFFEHEKTHGNYYGTAKNSFDETGDYALRLDVRGAMSVKNIYPESLVIFVDAPIEQIIRRLKAREESEEDIKTRLKTAKRELQQKGDADVIIQNLDNQLDKAYTDLKSAIENYLSIV